MDKYYGRAQPAHTVYHLYFVSFVAGERSLPLPRFFAMLRMTKTVCHPETDSISLTHEGSKILRCAQNNEKDIFIPFLYPISL